MSGELSVVIPVYHEGENVLRVHERFLADAGPFAEMIFVWDRPDDPTVPFIDQLRAQDPRVVSLHNTLGRGVLNALKAGIAAAQGPAILVAMGDLSDDLKVVPALLEQWRGGSSVACASRYMPGGALIGAPFLKGLLSRLAGLSLYGIGALPVRDPTNNFKLYDAAFLKGATIESSRGFELALELTVKAKEQGLKITEAPSTWQERTAGDSKFRLFKWLPGYLRWYWRALRNRFSPRARTAVGSPASTPPSNTPL